MAIEGSTLHYPLVHRGKFIVCTEIDWRMFFTPFFRPHIDNLKVENKTKKILVKS
jgi:hypothetical protein